MAENDNTTNIVDNQNNVVEIPYTEQAFLALLEKIANGSVLTTTERAIIEAKGGFENLSNFSGNFDDLINQPAIPCQIADFPDAENYATVEYVLSKINAIVLDESFRWPIRTSDLNNDMNFSTVFYVDNKIEHILEQINRIKFPTDLADLTNEEELYVSMEELLQLRSDLITVIDNMTNDINKNLEDVVIPAHLNTLALEFVTVDYVDNIYNQVNKLLTDYNADKSVFDLKDVEELATKEEMQFYVDDKTEELELAVNNVIQKIETLKTDVEDIEFGPVPYVDEDGEEQPSYAPENNVDSALRQLIADMAYVKSEMGGLSYAPINTTKFTANPAAGTYMLGRVLSGGINFEWEYSAAKLISQTFDGEELGLAVRTHTYSGNVSSNKTFTLVAKDKGGSTMTKSLSYTFANNIYWGAGSIADDMEAVVANAQSALSNSKSRTITVNCDPGQYIYYILPKRLGQCTFAVGGFTGGFKLLSTVSNTNQYNYTEEYNVYISENHSLGNTTIVIS